MPRKRLFILVLAAFLFVMGCILIGQPKTETKFAYLFFVGALLGFAYAFFGHLPEAVHRHAGIHDDEDPRNLPVRLFLPILFVVIVVACGISWYVLK